MSGKNIQLTSGAIEALMSNIGQTHVGNPILQVLKILQKNDQIHTARISDGTHWSTAVIRTSHLPLLSANCIIKLTKYETQALKGKLGESSGAVPNIHRPVGIVKLQTFEVIDSGSHLSLIGNPKKWGDKVKEETTGSSSTVQKETGKATASSNSAFSSGAVATSSGPPPSKRPATTSTMSSASSSASSSSSIGRASASSSSSSTGPSWKGAGASGYGTGGSSTSGATAATAGSSSKARYITKIEDLNPYQNRWTIRARVTHKSTMRTWSNSKGEGKLFDFILTDPSSEIKVTAFRNEADKLFDLLEVGKVYYVSHCSMKAANKAFSGGVKNDYEMSLTGESQLVEVEDESSEDTPLYNFSFVKLEDLPNVNANDFVDVLGVVKSDYGMSSVTGKTSNKEIAKRDLQIVDQGCILCKCTLWAEEAQNFEQYTANPIIAVKGAKVSDFGGRSLSVTTNSMMVVNPEINEVYELRGWFDTTDATNTYSAFSSDVSAGGASGGFQSTPWYKLSEVTKMFTKRTSEDKPVYFNAKATILKIKGENCLYQACPSDSCNKKVIDQGNGQFRCEKCDKEYGSFNWRLLLQMSICDHTDSIWVTCFQEVAEEIFQCTADEVGKHKENDSPEFYKIVNDATYRDFIFKMRSKVEVYNDEARMKTVCVGVSPVDPVTYKQKLVESTKEKKEEIARLTAKLAAAAV